MAITIASTNDSHATKQHQNRQTKQKTKKTKMLAYCKEAKAVSLICEMHLAHRFQL